MFNGPFCIAVQQEPDFVTSDRVPSGSQLLFGYVPFGQYFVYQVPLDGNHKCTNVPVIIVFLR